MNCIVLQFDSSNTQVKFMLTQMKDTPELLTRHLVSCEKAILLALDLSWSPTSVGFAAH